MGTLNSPSSGVVKDSMPSRRQILRCIVFGIGDLYVNEVWLARKWNSDNQLDNPLPHIPKNYIYIHFQNILLHECHATKARFSNWGYFLRHLRRWSGSIARRAIARFAARLRCSAGGMLATKGSCLTGEVGKRPVIIRRVQLRLTSKRLVCLLLLHVGSIHSRCIYKC